MKLTIRRSPELEGLNPGLKISKTFTGNGEGFFILGERMIKCVEYKLADISENDIIKRIKLQDSLMKNLRIYQLLDMDEKFLAVKGFFDFSFSEDDRGFTYSFFAILLYDTDTLLIKDFHKLLTVLLIDGEYYPVTYWQKAESGGRGTELYKLKKDALVQICADYSEGT